MKKIRPNVFLWMCDCSCSQLIYSGMILDRMLVYMLYNYTNKAFTTTKALSLSSDDQKLAQNLIVKYWSKIICKNMVKLKKKVFYLKLFF